MNNLEHTNNHLRFILENRCIQEIKCDKLNKFIPELCKIINLTQHSITCDNILNNRYARKIIELNKIYHSLIDLEKNLPSLKNKIITICSVIDKLIIDTKYNLINQTKLPVDYKGCILDKIDQKYQDLSCHKIHNQVVKNIFNQLSTNIPKGINLDVSDLKGNNSISSWLGILEIWKPLSKANYPHYDSIESNIELALVIASKIVRLDEMTNKKEIKTESYYAYLAGAEPPFEQEDLPEKNNRNLKVYQDYKLNLLNRGINQLRELEIPYEALLNEISWGILTTISNLKVGENFFFSTGTKRHDVLFNIVCYQTKKQKKRYRIEIFNTGRGIKNHEIDKNSKKIKPYNLSNLKLTHFTYPLISKIIDNSVSFNGSMDAFYSILNTLGVEHSQVELNLSDGKWYNRQNYGTCAYTCIEAYLFSRFTKKQKELYQQTKITVAFNKIAKYQKRQEKEELQQMRDCASKKRKSLSEYLEKDIENVKKVRKLLEAL